jgi:hypothetical protein
MNRLEKLFPSKQPLLTRRDRQLYRKDLLRVARKRGWIPS